jgi:hypothetical protein
VRREEDEEETTMSGGSILFPPPPPPWFSSSMNTHLKDMLAREFYTSSVVIINKAHSSRAS